MTAHDSVVVGLDMGTGGARAMAQSLNGEILAEGSARLPAQATVMAGPNVEQDPRAWSTAAETALRTLVDRLPTATKIEAVAVDATSGTFLWIDRKNQPLTPGYMYNDQRAVEVTPEVADALHAVLSRYGIQIASSFALPKIVHLMRREPSLFAQGHRIVHQTDWIVGLLCGNYDTTDISTALKTGADPGTLEWPAAIEQLGVPRQMLPRLVLPGTPIGHVTTQAHALTGLPVGTTVVAGCTDGTAGCLASGAGAAGDLNVTLGTTLVFKAVAPHPLLDPAGAIYNHRHPAGGYLPGAASSTGGDWIETCFPDARLAQMDHQALRCLPTAETVYPLVKMGERFPFVWPEARGFGLESVTDPIVRFAAGMESVAYLERLGIERFEHLGLPIGPTIYATGGGAASNTWLQIRASVTGRTLAVPAHAGCALGAAVLAAMPVLGGCQEAIARLVRMGRTIDPVAEWSDRYNELFETFCQALVSRGVRWSDA
ncbi:MAG: FGGY-family carbohydrate kinase [Pirellulaceae bacterium]